MKATVQRDSIGEGPQATSSQSLVPPESVAEYTAAPDWVKVIAGLREFT